MSFPNSAGVYDSIEDRSFVVSAAGLVAGGIVISAKRGPVTPKVITSAREFVDTYGLPSSDNPSMYCALRYLRRSGIITVRRVVNDAAVAEGALVATVEGQPEDHLNVTAISPGVWGNAVTVSFGTIAGSSNSFALIVKENGEEVERFEVSRNPNAVNGYGSNIFIENVVNTRSKLIRVSDNPAVEAAYNMASTITLTGGSDDTVAPTSGQINTAWDDFLNVNETPATMLINGGWAIPAVQTKMLAVAAARRVSVAILDAPQDTMSAASAMVDYRESELVANTYFGGIYGGWLRIYDQYNDKEVYIPPSGDVAGAFAYTFEVGERWDAPAGLQRGILPDVLGVSKVFTDGELDLLYTAGVNPITTRGGAAAVIWGQKTLQVQASALDRFNVVNNLLFITQRMKEALEPFVFQTNTQFTRDSVNFLLSNFLESIKLRGGLYNYAVDTSTEINTDEVIDQNQMYVDVYVQPVKAAEFIRLRTIVTRTGVTLG